MGWGKTAGGCSGQSPQFPIPSFLSSKHMGVATGAPQVHA